MAKRNTRRSKGMKKIEPAVMSLVVGLSAAPGQSQFTADLSQMASIANRRFYRQGLNWAVAGFKFSSLQPGTVSVQKLPSTWMVSNAWEKTFRLWNKQISETLDDAGNQSVRARYSDFKIFMDPVHRTAGSAANMLPVDANATAGAAGEWDVSHIVLPNQTADASGSLVDPDEFTVHMVGPSSGASKGMVQGYADSRSYPQSPDPVHSVTVTDMGINWMSGMQDDGSANPEILDNASRENDDLPYTQVNYPGGSTQLPGLEWHDIINIYSTSSTSNVGVQRGKGGMFPCGLVRVDWAPAVTSNLLIQVDLVPGPHRGYLAGRMQDM